MKIKKDFRESASHLVELLKEGIVEKQNSIEEYTHLKLGKYQIVDKIGEGGMGLVYKAWDTKLERLVALKVMLTSRGYSRKAKMRFIKEAKLTAQLDHPGIVKVHSIESEGDTDFIVMDFIDGTSLDEKMKQANFPTRKAATLIQRVASAMHYAHEHGIVHRDLKPSNLLINQDEEAIITDFGLAKDIRSEKVLTKTGEVLGTPIYMSPEQALGKKVGVTSDVYALGAILYELVCGMPVVSGGNTMEILLNIVDKDIIPPRQMNPKVHRDIEAICMKALDKKAINRYQTAKDLSRDLSNFLAGDVIEAAPFNLRRRIWKKAIKLRWKIAFITLVVLSFITALFSQKYMQDKEERDETAHWQKKVTQSIVDSYKLLSNVDTFLLEGKNLIGKRPKVDLSQMQTESKEAFLNYDENIFAKWKNFQKEVAKLKDLSQQYHGYVADVKENSYLEESSFTILPKYVTYFNLGQSNYAQGVLQYIQNKSEELQKKAKKNYARQNLELAKWQLEYATQLNRKNSGAHKVRLEIQNSIQSRLNEILELTLSIQGQQGLVWSSILEDLYDVCLMDCSFESSYYQIGKIYYNLRAMKEAETFYGKALLRQENPFALYYLSEIRFFKWRSYYNDQQREKYYLDSFRQLIKERDRFQNSEKYQNLSDTAKSHLQLISFYDTVINEEFNSRLRHLNFYFCSGKVTRLSVENDKEAKKKYEAGIVIYKKLLRLLDQSENSVLTSQINYLRGLIYMDLAILEESHHDEQPYFIMSLEKLKAAAKGHIAISLYWKIAKIYFCLQDYEKTVEYYEKVYDNLEVWALKPDHLDGNYWENLNNYIVALSNLGRYDVANRLMLDYIKLFEDLIKKTKIVSAQKAADVHLYRSRIELLYTTLASLNWVNGRDDMTKEYFLAANSLKNVDNPGMYIECYIYAILAIKYGELEVADRIIQKILQHQNVQEFYPLVLLFSGSIQKHFQALASYDDLFQAHPKFRKLPSYFQQLIARFNKAKQIHQTFDLSFLKPQMLAIMEDKDLQKKFTQLPKNQSVLSILPLFFYLYLKQNVDLSEKRLQKMKILSPAQLYKRANAFFRQGKIEQSYLDLHRALEDSNNQARFRMKYHYAMAICLGHKLKKKSKYKELMYQHLWLALAMGWNNIDYTKNDPAFASVIKEKRFQNLMNHPPQGLENYSLKQIQILTKSWSQESHLAPMLMEIFQAKVQSY